jgi:hypothetical protein
MSTITVLEEVHKNDIGTVIEITLKNGASVVDISSATTKEIKLKKPVSATVLTKAAVFVTDGTDGKMKYTTISGDLDEVGVWQVQGHIINPSGEWHSDIKNMSVFDNVN